MELIKNQDNVLIKTKSGEYHFSNKEFNKLGENKAIYLALLEIELKNSSNFNDLSIDFNKAKNLGFCSFGIEDFCNKLNLDINKTYKISYLRPLVQSNLELMFEYQDEIIKIFTKSIFTEIEEIISKNANYSYWYVRFVIKGRFKLGEEIISKDAKYAYLYATYVIKGEFKLGEEAISKDANYSYYYAKDVIKGEFKLGEKIISKSAYYSSLYNKMPF